MAWTGIGCLLEFINSVVWNNNMVLRAPFYCLFVTRYQIALNVAIPISSLLINRRLYKIATIKTVTVTESEKRRAVIFDLVVGLGFPVLQVIAEYIVSYHKYTIYEDIGPIYSYALIVESILLFSMWPIVIGCVSLFYSLSSIYTLLRRQHQFSKIMSSNRDLNRSRYFRLMALAFTEICCTIPLASFFLARVVHTHPGRWKSWKKTHDNGHYEDIVQIPASIWKAIPFYRFNLEMFRWLLPLAAFIFFGYFGFADEARQHYRLAFRSIATRVGFSTASLTFQGSSNASSSITHMKNKGDVSISVVATSRNKRDSMLSFTDQLSIPSISIPNDLKSDIKIEEFSPSETMVSSTSTDSLDHGASHLTVVALPALPPSSVPPHHADSAEPTVRTYSSDVANAV